MNFSIIDGQLARWLEFLASYDFEIRFRRGNSHTNCDSLSRRPCVDNDCKYCSRYEERDSANEAGLITRRNGETVGSIKQGESSDEVGLVRQVCTKKDELDSLVCSTDRSNIPLLVRIIREVTLRQKIPKKAKQGDQQEYFPTNRIREA